MLQHFQTPAGIADAHSWRPHIFTWRGRAQTKTCPSCYFQSQHHPAQGVDHSVEIKQTLTRKRTVKWEKYKPDESVDRLHNKTPMKAPWGNDRVVSSTYAWNQGCFCFHTLSVGDDDSLGGFIVRLSCLSPAPGNINVPSVFNQTRTTAPAHSPLVWH